MIIDRAAVQTPDLMGQVTVEAVLVQVSTVIRADMEIKATKVVTIIKGSTATTTVRLLEPPEVVE